MDVYSWGITLLAQTALPAPWLGEGALAGLTSFLIAAWLNEWVVSGKVYRRDREEHLVRITEETAKAKETLDSAKKEIEYWRAMALENLGLIEKAVNLAERRPPTP